MLGNRLGWLLSLCIVTMTALFLWSIHYIGNRMPEPGPVGLNAASYTMTLPADPRTVATWMSEDLDATPLYHQAIAEHDANPRAFERYIQSGTLTSEDARLVEKAVQLLVQARTSKGTGGVFGHKPELVITYDVSRPALRSLRNVGRVAERMGRLNQTGGNPARAKEIYEGMYTLGIKLMEERLAYDEWSVGRNLLMSKWIVELPEYSGDAHRFNAVEQQFKLIGNNSIRPVYSWIYLLNPDPDSYPAHETWTGDMIAVATRGGDPMWRIEATLALGRARFQGARRGDQVSAEKTLKELVSDPNPFIQFAAKAARELTREELRKIPTVIE